MIATDTTAKHTPLKVLVHELGHALGLDRHVEAELCVYGDEAVMCDGSKTDTITEIDIGAVCGARTEPCR